MINSLKSRSSNVYHVMCRSQYFITPMEFYGIRNKFNDLIQSYVSNRYQRVFNCKGSYCHGFSKLGMIKFGVPQVPLLRQLFSYLCKQFAQNYYKLLPTSTFYRQYKFNYY